MLALGLDPGIERTGWGLVESKTGRLRPVAWGLITTPSTDTTARRLVSLRRDVQALLDKGRPDVAIVEKLFFKKNVTSAINVAHARGVVLLTLEEYKIRCVEVTPPEVKVAVTGNGAAPKPQVIAMVKRLLALTDRLGPDDVADALAISLCGLLREGA